MHPAERVLGDPELAGAIGDVRMFMKVHSVFTKVHSRGAVLRARRLRLPRTPPRGAVCAAGV